MEFRQLEQFKVVAELENLSKASTQLFVSQPALTTSIRKLEDELGVNLFDRAGKSLKLNTAGKTLLEYAGKMEQLYQEMEEAMSAYNDTSGGISLCTDELLFWLYLIPEYRQSTEDPDFQAVLCNENDISSELLLNEKYNLVSSLNPLKGRNICNQILFTDRVMLNAPANSPFCQYDSLKPEQLRDLKLMIGNIDSKRVKRFRHAMEKRGVQINYENMYNFEFYSHHIATADGYGISSEELSRFYHLSERKLIPIEGDDFSMCYYASYLAKNKTAVAPFTDWMIHQRKLRD